MSQKFNIKEIPDFDDSELYTSFTEWYQRVSEERITLDEITAKMKIGSQKRINEYMKFYQRIGMVSNDMFNDFTEIK